MPPQYHRITGQVRRTCLVQLRSICVSSVVGAPRTRPRSGLQEALNVMNNDRDLLPQAGENHGVAVRLDLLEPLAFGEKVVLVAPWRLFGGFTERPLVKELNSGSWR